jgi:TPR repeat protein
MAQKSLGKKVMLSASELGEKSATFELISSAIRTGSIQEYQAPLRRLGILAKRDGDPQAMLLLGKVLYGQRGDSEALSWFQKATRPPTGTLEFNGASEALVQEGRILLSRKDHSGARKAFLKAALELDDPTAYFYLSKLEEFGSPKQEVYLTKASTSGIPEAWHNLGAIELARDTGKAISGMKDYGMAREWFLVAASDGFGLSMLNLALMHKSVGEVEEGLEWLEKAEELVEVADEARSLKRQWTSEQVRESDS